MSRRWNLLLGFFGMFGLFGFKYFTTHNPSYLAFFGFFSFFANFFLARLDLSLADERYLENIEKAKAFAFDIALVEIVVMFLTSLVFSLLFPLAVLGRISIGLVAICYASLIIAYGMKLYELEER
ncbi:MAG TPA: DUF3796 domain-containing protein [Bacillota bacterium]|nr:DUF3796 domain-containing protein [Bacillota bacterium]